MLIGGLLSPSSLKLRGLAAGGGIWASIVVVALLYLGVQPSYGTGGRAPRCLVNVKQIGVSLYLYASDNNDLFPSDRWMDRLGVYSREDDIFHCPAVDPPGYGYAMSAAELGKKAPAGSSDDVLAYDSTKLERNVVGNIRTDFAPRHQDKGRVVFADTHARSFTADAFKPRP
jgi:hypothetical protein